MIIFLGAPSSVNPARAGMILAWQSGDVSIISKPRASGDDPHNVEGQAGTVL